MRQRGDIVVPKLAVLMAVTVLLTVGNAQAQEWTGRGFISVSGGGQLGERQFETNLAVPKFSETARFETEHTLSQGGILHVGGGLRVWNNFAAGVGFSLLGKSDDITGGGTVPNPLFFDRPRTVTYTETGLERRETGIHFSAFYVVPISERLMLTFFGGPTIFRVRQDLVGDIELGPETDAPLFRNVTVSSVVTRTVNETGFGGHIGLDGTFMLNDQLGVGGFFRYSGGSVELPTGNTRTSVDVGGPQLGGGLRLFF